MRKPVVLITGAGGEIGHGLITRLAQDASRGIITLDVNPLEPALGQAGRARVPGARFSTRNLLDRIVAEYEVDLVFHLAALLSSRSEFTPIAAHEVNVGGTLNLLEFAQKQGEAHGRPVVFLYPSSIAVTGAGPRIEGAGRRGQGRPVHAPDHDVRVQQALLRAARQLLHETLQAARPGHGEPEGRLPLRAVPRPDLGGDRAVGRHLGLRARDDPRGGPRRGLRVLRAARHADPVHGDAGRRRGAPPARGRPAGTAAPNGLQRRRVQPVGRRGPAGGARVVPGRGDRLQGGRAAPGDRRLVAGRRRRLLGAEGLGLRPGLRFRPGVLPDTSSRPSASGTRSKTWPPLAGGGRFSVTPSARSSRARPAP